MGSLWVGVHGHGHPKVDAALRTQIDKVAHSTFLGLSHEPGIRLAQALVRIAPPGLERVFYSDSGSTAVENVTPNSPGAAAGVKPGFSIVRVGDRRGIVKPDDVAAAKGWGANQ